MNSKLSKNIDKGVNVMRVLFAIIIIIGFIGFMLINKAIGSVTGRVRKDYSTTVERHQQQLDTPLEIGSTFYNREKLKVTLVAKEQRDKLLMLEFEISTDEMLLDGIENSFVTNKQNPMLKLIGYTFPKGVRDDEKFMALYLSECRGKGSTERLYFYERMIYLPASHLNSDENGYYISDYSEIPGRPGHKVSNGDVYYQTKSRVKYYINTEVCDFLSLQPLYEPGVNITWQEDIAVDNDPTSIYIDLSK